LDLARALVSLVLNLPEWTKRTSQLSSDAKQVRQALIRASDPHRVLFMDLPALLGGTLSGSITDSIARCIAELHDAYPNMLRSVESQVLRMLDHRGSVADLANRGKTVSGISGDSASMPSRCAWLAIQKRLKILKP